MVLATPIFCPCLDPLASVPTVIVLHAVVNASTEVPVTSFLTVYTCSLKDENNNAAMKYKQFPPKQVQDNFNLKGLCHGNFTVLRRKLHTFTHGETIHEKEEKDINRFFAGKVIYSSFLTTASR